MANQSQVDTDGDGVGDLCDEDADGDGATKDVDCAPLDPTIYPGKVETCDGQDDDCDGFIDEGFPNFDEDALADCLDEDDDNDGDPDVTDCKPLNPAVNQQAKEICDGQDNDCDGEIDEGFEDAVNCKDLDGDGIDNALDNCPKVPNVDQADFDQDGAGDLCDPDDDGDGDPDVTDCAPFDATIGKTNPELCDGTDNNCDTITDEGFPDTDSDGEADCIDDDDDGDGIPDDQDNCPSVANPGQEDEDFDGIGDACKPPLVTKLVEVRDSPGGGGATIPGKTVIVDEDITVHAIGLSGTLEFVEDIEALWSWRATGKAVVELDGGAPSTTVTFAPAVISETGRICAEVSGQALACTGLLVVVAPPPAVVHLGKTIVSTDKPTLITGIGDSTVVKVIVKDKFDQTITAPHVVTIAATAGTLVGDVVQQPNGVYTQVLEAPDVGVIITVTATVDGSDVPDDAEVHVIDVTNPVKDGDVSVDCAGLAPFKGKNIFVEGGEFEINTEGCAPFEFGHLIVGPNGSITHPEHSHETPASISLSVLSVLIEPGGTIDVSGRGFEKGVAPIDEATASTSNCGASHGGLGRVGYDEKQNCERQVTYGSYIDPRLHGSGGGNARGGGVVRILVDSDGTFIVRGTINADGGDGNQAAGGSGGSIALDTPHLGGGGAITARGGKGQSYGGGGGGGRVAVVNLAVTSGGFAEPATYDSIQVFGGTNGATNRAGAGTVFLKPVGETHGTLIINNDGADSSPGSTDLVSVPQGSVTKVVGNSVEDDSADNGEDFFTDYSIILDTEQGTPSLLDDTVFQILGNTSFSFELDKDATGATEVGQFYRNIYVLDRLEIRGGANVRTSGDILVLQGDGEAPTDGIFTMDGGLIAQRLELAVDSEIHISSGTLQAQQVIGDGKPGFQFDYELDNGGLTLDAIAASSILGIDSALAADSASVVGSVTLSGGTVDVAGVLQVTGLLSLTDVLASVGQVDAGDALVLDGATELEILDDLVQVVGLVLMTGESVITHSASDTEAIRRVDLTAKTIIIEPNASIDATARGWPGKIGLGGLEENGSVSNCGGSHGGIGLNGGSGTSSCKPAIPYGSYMNPTLPGSGSGHTTAGGGVLLLTASEKIIVHGDVRADGETKSQTAGGAGGSIRLTSPIIIGNGVLSATGGKRHSKSSKYGGSGGGGRIALLGMEKLGGGFEKDGVPAHAHTTGFGAGAGTVYVHGADAEWGDLYIDGQGEEAFEGSTPLLSVPDGPNAGVTDTTLATPTEMLESFFADYWINVKVGSGQPTLADDPIHRIVDNNTFELQFADDTQLTQTIAFGDPLRAIHVFQQLEIIGRASVVVGGDVLVFGGDAGSGDETTLRLGGGLKVKTLDVQGVDTITLDEGQLDAETVIAGGDPKGKLHITLKGESADLKMPTVYALDLGVTDGTVTAEGVDSTGDISVTGGVVLADWLKSGADITMVGTLSDIETITADGSVTVSGGTLDVDTISAGVDVEFAGDAAVNVRSANITAGDTIRLLDTAVLTHPEVPEDEALRWLHLQAKHVSVLDDAQINADEKGYGPLLTVEGATAASGRAGGSHGGIGWRLPSVPSWTQASAYGFYGDPKHPGGGGGGSTNGGGVVRIDASESCVINGTISVLGQHSISGSTGSTAAGAGGSIRITAPTLTILGTVTAAGGGAYSSGSSKHGGAGGGGRIALLGVEALTVGTDGLLGNVHANSEFMAGAGTIFLKFTDDDNGRLYVDNHDEPAAIASTPLSTLPPGLVTDIVDDGIVKLSEPMEPGALAGFKINLNTAQDETPTLGDDTLLLITDNTADTVTVTPGDGLGDLVGDELTEYRITHVFDELTIRGGARVADTADILVVSGDDAEGDTTLLMTGGLQALKLDISNVTAFTAEFGVLNLETLVSGGILSPALTWKITGPLAGLTIPTINAETLDATDATLTADSLASNGAITTVDTDILVTALEAGGDLSVTGATLTGATLKGKANATILGATTELDTIDVTLDLVLGGESLTTIFKEAVTAGQALVLQDEAVLDHPPLPKGEALRRLNITAETVTIKSDAKIDVTARGHYPGYWMGGATLGASNSVCGASHGGLGARRGDNLHTTCELNPTYGHYADPQHPGAGGGSGTLGLGGGVVHIAATNAVTIDGQIIADAPHAQGQAAGAGGSIRISAAIISGSGSVHANGGYSHQSSKYGGGGGGGRIAFLDYQFLTGNFVPALISQHVTANGDGGGAGTIYMLGKEETAGILVIDNAGKGTNANLGRTALVTPPCGTILGVEATTLTAESDSMTPDFYVGYTINVDVGATTGSLAQAPVVTIDSNTAAAYSVADDVDLTELTQAAATCRAIFIFDQLQVSGDARLTTTGDMLVLNGSPQSDDGTAFNVGGSIEVNWLDLNGVTDFSAAGGGLDIARIITQGKDDNPVGYSLEDCSITMPSVAAAAWSSKNTTLAIDALTTTDDFLSIGDTITISALSVGGSLTMTGGVADIGTIDIAVDALFDSNAVLTVTQDVLTVGDFLRIKDTALLTHPKAVEGEARRLHITTKDVLLGPNAKIDVTEKGWPAGIGVGGTPEFASDGNCGGSNGGFGANGSTGTYNCVIGRPGSSPRNPTEPGGGGASYVHGGGVVLIDAAGAAQIDGQILADGGSGLNVAGGAGGSIRISATGISGAGAVHAKGGTAPTKGKVYTGAGGGGRIALRNYGFLEGSFLPLVLPENVLVHGGGNHAGAGTVFFEPKTATHGTLLVNNTSGPSTVGATTLNDLSGKIVFIEGSEVHLSNTTVEDQHGETLFNPNTQQGSALPSDDKYFEITENTEITVTLDLGDDSLTAVAGTGTPYRTIHYFDNLGILGGGHLKSFGDIVVKNGDFYSGNSTDFKLSAGAKLEAARLELQGISDANIEGDITTTDGLFCSSDPCSPGD